MNPFESLREYESFVYTLSQRFPHIVRSSLIVARRGRQIAELIGDLAFPSGYRLAVYERLTWDTGPLTIEGYSEIETTLLQADSSSNVSKFTDDL